LKKKMPPKETSLGLANLGWELFKIQYPAVTNQVREMEQLRMLSYSSSIYMAIGAMMLGITLDTRLVMKLCIMQQESESSLIRKKILRGSLWDIMMTYIAWH